MDFSRIIVSLENEFNNFISKVDQYNDDLRLNWNGDASDKYFSSISDIKVISNRVKFKLSLFIEVGSKIMKLEQIDEELKNSVDDSVKNDDNILRRQSLIKEINDILNDIRNGFLESKIQAINLLDTNLLLKPQTTNNSKMDNIMMNSVNVEPYTGLSAFTKNIIVPNFKLPDAYGSKYYNPSTNNPVACNGRAAQCTSYAYGRFNEIADSNSCSSFTGRMGDGSEYYAEAKKKGFDVSQNILDVHEGDAVCWKYSGFPHGHVAIVEKVNTNESGTPVSVVISEGHIKNGDGWLKVKKTELPIYGKSSLSNRSFKGAKFVGLVHQTNKE